MVGPRVFLVDDHEAFRTAAVALLESEGLEIVGTAASGEDALEALANCAPDVVLLDFLLPGMDGVEAAALIARMESPPDVILISSRSEAVSDPRVQAAEVLGFLAKQDLTCTAIRALVG